MGPEIKGEENGSLLISDQMQTKATRNTFWRDQKGITRAALGDILRREASQGKQGGN